MFKKRWGGRWDLNPRPPGPQPGALTNWATTTISNLSPNILLFFKLSSSIQKDFLNFEVFFGFRIDFSGNSGILPNTFKCAPVAQLDRASASGVEGREFKSRRVHHFYFKQNIYPPPNSMASFLQPGNGMFIWSWPRRIRTDRSSLVWHSQTRWNFPGNAWSVSGNG